MKNLLVYLFHLAEPLSGSGAQHYIGITNNLDRRLYEHYCTSKGGAVMLRKARLDRITFKVVLTVHPASHRDERTMKSIGGKRLCPLCSDEAEAILAKRGLLGAASILPTIEVPDIHQADPDQR